MSVPTDRTTPATSTEVPRSRRVVRARLLLLLAGTVAGLLIVEAGLRLAGYRPAYANVFRSFHQPHPLIGLHGRPHHAGRFRTGEIDAWTELDGRGFRRPAVQSPIESSQRRIVLLGDSFAWGWGVGQGEVISDRISLLRPSWHVENLGLSATGPLQQLRLFEEYAGDLIGAGDVLLYLFFWNDFSDNVDGRDGSLLHARVDAAGRLELVEPELESGSTVKEWLRQHSAVFNLLLFHSNRLKGEVRAGASAPRFGSARATDEDLAAMRGALEALEEAASRRGAELVVAIVPAPTDLGLEETVPGDAADARALRRDLERILADVGARSVDLLPAFRAARDRSPAQRLYYRLDRHWTAVAHRVAARAIVEAIEAGDGVAAEEEAEWRPGSGEALPASDS